MSVESDLRGRECARSHQQQPVPREQQPSPFRPSLKVLSTIMRALSQLLVLLLVFIDSAAPALPTLPVSRAPAPTLSHSRSLVRSSSASSTLSASRAWVEDALAPSTASIQKAGAMPFLTVDPTNNTLSLNPNALQALSELYVMECAVL